MADWIITVPKTVKWKHYRAELTEVESNPGTVMNYRVARRPRDMVKGDRMFVVHDGHVRGWMEIVGVVNHPHGFTCSTTGTFWPPGWYIQRAGRFTYVDPIPMKGFQGYRRFDAPAGN